MASLSRPIRNRNQPSRNKDNIELNLELIERLEANRANKLSSQGTTNYAKLLASFVNSINQQYRASLLRIENQKKEQSVSKTKQNDNGDNAEWGHQRERKRYVVGSGSKISTRTLQGTKPQQQIKIEKNQNNDQIKYNKISKNSNTLEGNQQKPTKNVIKESKKVVLLTIPPPQDLNTMRKPFRRCSYHIGIAYNIYMAQIKEKNPQIDPKDCDPTIFARRLKMQQLGEQRQSTPHKRQMKFIQQGM